MPAYRVYISSTEQDLKPERLNLKISLEQAGYDPRCMEKYAAFSNRPKDECEQDVRSSHIYVVIVGERYGSLPTLPNGTQLEKSFTEYEYEAALSEKNIPKLAFIKKIARDPNNVKLQGFVTRLQVNHGIKEFTDPDELSKQVLIAITNVTGKATRNGLNPNLRYYCNRSEQAIRFDELFYKLNYNNHIHFYLLAGHAFNYHDSFIKRYKFEFQSKNFDEEPVDISFDVKVNPNDTEGQLVQKIKGLINVKVKTQFGIEPLDKVDAYHLMQLLSRLKKHFLFINLNIQSSYLKAGFADIYKSSIEKFYADFTGLQQQEKQDKKIIIFLNLKYLDNVQNEEIVRRTFTENPFYTDKKLPPLTKLTTDDMTEWLESNDIEVNPSRLFKLVSQYFQPLADTEPDGDFYMADADIKMEELIGEYNNKKP